MLRMKSSLAEAQSDHRLLCESEDRVRSELQGANRKAALYRDENHTLLSNYDRWVNHLVEASTGDAIPPPPRGDGACTQAAAHCAQ
jgi:hypothetical protein